MDTHEVETALRHAYGSGEVTVREDFRDRPWASATKGNTPEARDIT